MCPPTFSDCEGVGLPLVHVNGLSKVPTAHLRTLNRGMGGGEGCGWVYGVRRADRQHGGGEGRKCGVDSLNKLTMLELPSRDLQTALHD